MSDLSVRFMQTRRKPEKPTPEGESKALDRMQLEARRHGATLHSEGRGGLPASVVLGILRRDNYQCKKCGGMSDLTMHHKADTMASEYLRRLKKVYSRTDPQSLVTLCHACHDAVHEEARENSEDSQD